MIYMIPFVVKIGDEAGFGITSAGTTLAKIVARSGYHCFQYMEYPSLIRGGHNVVSCTIGKTEILAPYQHTDLLIALNQETLDKHIGELSKYAIVLYDEGKHINISKLPVGVSALAVPLSNYAKNLGQTILMRDSVAIGAVLSLLGGNTKILQDILNEEFAKKGSEVINKNIACAEAGYKYILQNFQSHITSVLQAKKANPRLVVNANQTVALGAVAAGMQFCAIYPMTPTSNILHVLAPLQEQFGFIYKQPEDEIAAINMALGASFAGARSMVATAGGGFCLMAEGYGLAGITESPLVIIEGMRPGPATGLPTWTGQADLLFMLHAGQDNFPKIILTPGDAEEAFYQTMEAFNLADIYQTPVVVMVDKHLCESHADIKPLEYKMYSVNRGKYSEKKVADYNRYALSEDGISPRIPAGRGVHVIANSDEHSPLGYSNEESQNRIEQMQKRMKKLETCALKSMPEPTVYGPTNAKLTIVSWGSNKGAILEALKEFKNVNFLHINWVSPFPTIAVKKVLGKAKKILNIESNFTGQMQSIIAEKTGINIESNLFKYDGRPIYPEEVYQKIKTLL